MHAFGRLTSAAGLFQADRGLLVPSEPAESCWMQCDPEPFWSREGEGGCCVIGQFAVQWEWGRKAAFSWRRHRNTSAVKQETICLQGWVFVRQNQAGHAGDMVNTQQPPNWSLPRELWLQKSLKLRELTSAMVGNSTKDAELCRELQP